MDKEMVLSDHLNELRRRLIIAILAILAATALSFFFSDRILQVLLLPSGGLHLQAFSLMDGFLIKTRIALYAGIVLAFPAWAYEAYAFVSPGLTDSERGLTFPMFLGSLALFTIGTIFGFYLLWGIIKVLIGLFPSEVSLLPNADSYISFVVFFLLACGIAFQLPTALILLVELHLLSSDLMRRHRKSAYFALFVFAEIITPVSDPIVAPMTVMVPLVILYELSIYLGKRIEIRRRALKPDLQKSA